MNAATLGEVGVLVRHSNEQSGTSDPRSVPATDIQHVSARTSAWPNWSEQNLENTCPTNWCFLDGMPVLQPGRGCRYNFSSVSEESAELLDGAESAHVAGVVNTKKKGTSGFKCVPFKVTYWSCQRTDCASGGCHMGWGSSTESPYSAREVSWMPTRQWHIHNQLLDNRSRSQEYRLHHSLPCLMQKESLWED